MDSKIEEWKSLEYTGSIKEEKEFLTVIKKELENENKKSDEIEIELSKIKSRILNKDSINFEKNKIIKKIEDYKKQISQLENNLTFVSEKSDTSIFSNVHSNIDSFKREIEKLVSVKSWASCGVDPALMGTGPIPSSKKALELAGWDINEVDLFEINEAFAAQSLAVLKTLSIPEEKVNVNGGAIALGHPIGASGTRILVTLIHEMIKRDVKKGLATLCIGGGMGIAMCVER